VAAFGPAAVVAAGGAAMWTMARRSQAARRAGST
jgi:hypothetical protein